MKFDELTPGEKLGSYTLIREIGRGGFGVIYEATHDVLPRRVAIKVMHKELVHHPGIAARMVREATFLDDVRHPGITRVFESSILPDRRVWMAMEIVDGESLQQRIQNDGPLVPYEAATIIGAIADVLAAVHARGVVHRDLKPDNVLIASGDPDFPVRVIDWGIARFSQPGRLTEVGRVPGTPLYMAPDQAAGETGAASDIYSLGVTAYEALVGRPPFKGKTSSEVIQAHMTTTPVPLESRCSAPAQLCDLVHRMLEKSPGLRPTALEVRQQAAAIARAVSRPLELFECDGAESIDIAPMVDDDMAIPFADQLELGVTEPSPVSRARRERVAMERLVAA